MEEPRVKTPALVPAAWVVAPPALCACPVPVPESRATRKGAARTHCVRCGLPVRLEFGSR